MSTHSLLLTEKHAEKQYVSKDQTKDLYRFIKFNKCPTFYEYIKCRCASEELLASRLSCCVSEFLGHDIKVESSRDDLLELLERLQRNKWSDWCYVSHKLGFSTPCNEVDLLMCLDRLNIDRSNAKHINKRFVELYSSDRRFSNFARALEKTASTNDEIDFAVRMKKRALVEHYRSRGIDFSFINDMESVFEDNEYGDLVKTKFFKERIKRAKRAELALRRVEWCMLGIQRLPNHSILVSELSDETICTIMKADLDEKNTLVIRDNADRLFMYDVSRHS